MALGAGTLPYALAIVSSSLRITRHQPLKIGVLWHDNVVQPHPPITSAFRSVVAKLKPVLNVSVVNWQPYLHDEAWVIISSLYFTDGGAEDGAAMADSGEPWRPLTKWIMKENPRVKDLSTHELYYWQEEREAYRTEYARVWNDTSTGRNEETGKVDAAFDVILCPAGPGVAQPHNTAKYWGYTSQWNLLDYPAVVFPVTRVSSEVDTAGKSHKFMTDIDRRIGSYVSNVF